MSTPLAEPCLRGDCRQAIQLFEDRLRHEPSNHDLHYRLGCCYSGACRPHDLVNLPISIVFLGRAVALLGPDSPPSLRPAYEDALGNAQLWNHRPDSAISHLERAAEGFLALGLLEDWSRGQHNLGNAHCELPESAAPGKWLCALEHYRNALRIRTREHDPERHAATLQNLGTAYRQLAEGGVGNVLEAARCYLSALRICSRLKRPDRQAELHNNLGNAYLSMDGSRKAQLRNTYRAISHLKRALEVRNRLRRPGDYAITQFNIGQAYLKRASLSAGDGLKEAASSFREAVECFEYCRQPEAAGLARTRLELVESCLESRELRR
jgi:tetratricopeptide (TPR) repeat protein